jgi:hypothetical protein
VHTVRKVDLENLNVAAPPILNKYRGTATAVAAVSVILTIVGFVLNPTQALHAYLIGFMLCMGLTLGPIAFVFIWYMTAGRWGFFIRRVWEAAARNILYNVILFVPIVIWYKHLFPWAYPEHYADNPNMQRLMHEYLNFNAFLTRGVVYFAIFLVIIYLSCKWSSIQDRPHVTFLGPRLNGLGGVGVVLYFFAMSFGVVDWMMSLKPAWPSTIYAMNVLVGQGILGLAVGIITATILVRYEPMSGFLDDVVFHDNGKLLLAFVMLWAYTGFSQWLIIWSGNLPEEIVYYLDRLHGGWQYASLFLVLFEFCVPFAMLLSASLKKNPRQLVWVAVWLVVMRWYDLCWNIEGSYHPGHLGWSGMWMDLVIPVAMVAIWIVLFIRNYMAHPTIPLYDPHVFEMVGVEPHE